MNDNIRQIKINAISGKNLHRKSKSKYEVINNSILILTIIVPLLFIIAVYVSKGTDFEVLINTISFILSVLLIIISVISLVFKINDKIIIFKMGIKNNIYIANECDNLANADENELKWFFRYVTEIDQQDNDTYPNISKNTKRELYREALKEFTPGDHTVVCPICNSSPWKYKKGNCQLCGNTEQEIK
jgi:mobilome CxxCx(11)CxxC protein